MTQIKTCETCQHWEKQDSVFDKHVGRCHAVYQYFDAMEWDEECTERRMKAEHANHLAFVQDASDYFAMLLTRPNFGCVQHKQNAQTR